MKAFIASALIIISTIVAGCSTVAMLTPTIVPPGSEELGYDVPDLWGITTVGLIRGSVKVEEAKLKAFDTTATVVIESTEETKGGLIEILAVLGLGGTATLPFALKKLPKGATMKGAA